MKEIPVLLHKDRTNKKGHKIDVMKEYKPMISRVYDKFWRTYNIYKIYHVQGRSIHMEIEAK